MRMQRRHSLPVAYPLQHIPGLQRLWRLFMGFNAVVLMLWWWQGAGFGTALWLRVALSVAMWLLCGLWSWRALRSMPLGSLRWNGQCWAWENGMQQCVLHGGPVIVLDMQWLLVITLEDQQLRRQRFVLQRDSAPHQWQDMRRAVYSSVYPTQVGAVSKTS